MTLIAAGIGAQAQSPNPSHDLASAIHPTAQCSIEVQLVQGWLEPIITTIELKRSTANDSGQTKLEGHTELTISGSIHRLSVEIENGVAELHSSMASINGVPFGYQFSTLGIASLLASKAMRLGDAVPISVTTHNVNVLKSQTHPKNHYSVEDARKFEDDGVHTLRSNLFCMIRTFKPASPQSTVRN